jgi:hypothetical protein
VTLLVALGCRRPQSRRIEEPRERGH